MDREQIYSELQEQIPYLQRRECTPRVMQATDLLLDQLIEIQRSEELEGILDDRQRV